MSQADAHDPHAHDDGMVHVHVHPASVYWKILGALMMLTLLTVGISRIHLGEWNFFIAVAVATVKAALVASFFMHLKDDNRFNVLLFIGALLFIGVFFVYTLNDTEHRGQWDDAYGTQVSGDGQRAPGRGLADEIKVEHAAGHHEEHH